MRSAVTPRADAANDEGTGTNTKHPYRTTDASAVTIVTPLPPHPPPHPRTLHASYAADAFTHVGAHAFSIAAFGSTGSSELIPAVGVGVTAGRGAQGVVGEGSGERTVRVRGDAMAGWSGSKTANGPRCNWLEDTSGRAAGAVTRALCGVVSAPRARV